MSKQAALNAQVSYAENKDLAVVANVAYTIVPGFKITPEVAWNSVHTDDGTKIRDGFGAWAPSQRAFLFVPPNHPTGPAGNAGALPLRYCARQQISGFGDRFSREESAGREKISTFPANSLARAVPGPQ